MALITIPAIPEKATIQTYTLNVTDLIALISDTYFQQQTNWSSVVVMYQSSVSNQIEGITFTPDGVSTSLEADATFSLEARDIFNVQSITVVDKQNGRNITYAASIPDVANYTIDFTPVSAIEPFSLTLRNPSLNVLSNSNFTCERNAASFGFYGFFYANNVIPMASGKYYKEITYDVYAFTSNSPTLGIRLMNTSPSDFAPNGGAGMVQTTDNQYQLVYIIGGGSAQIVSQVGPSGGIPSVITSLPPILTGDKISFAIDFDSPTKDFYMAVNGVWFNSANPVTGAGKIELTSVFPGLPVGLSLYFAIASLSPEVWSVQQVPLYKPVGYTNV